MIYGKSYYLYVNGERMRGVYSLGQAMADKKAFEKTGNKCEIIESKGEKLELIYWHDGNIKEVM